MFPLKYANHHGLDLLHRSITTKDGVFVRSKRQSHVDPKRPEDSSTTWVEGAMVWGGLGFCDSWIILDRFYGFA